MVELAVALLDQREQHLRGDLQNIGYQNSYYNSGYYGNQYASPERDRIVQQLREIRDREQALAQERSNLIASRADFHGDQRDNFRDRDHDGDAR